MVTVTELSQRVVERNDSINRGWIRGRISLTTSSIKNFCVTLAPDETTIPGATGVLFQGGGKLRQEALNL